MTSPNAATPHIDWAGQQLVNHQSLIQALLKNKAANNAAAPQHQLDLILSNLDVSTRALLLEQGLLDKSQQKGTVQGGFSDSSSSIELLLSLLSKKKNSNTCTASSASSGVTSAASKALLTAVLGSRKHHVVDDHAPVVRNDAKEPLPTSSTPPARVRSTSSSAHDFLPQSVAAGKFQQGMPLLPPAFLSPFLQATHLASSSQTKARTISGGTTSHEGWSGGEESTTSAQDDSTVVDKKKKKRDANRISAQQSRKRKKQYFDDLKEENDELRKLNHVLALLPDLILSFDSSGAIRFVSCASVEVFGSPPREVEGTSFWSRICPKSAPVLKAAFMDALAARENTGKSSVSFGERVWEIRIKKDDPIGHEQADGPTWAYYTLHGIVHFGGNVPECICTIRPSPSTRKLV